jgi:hypothetical protein
MKTLRMAIRYWNVIGRVGRLISDEQETLSKVRVDPEIAVRLTEMAIKVAKAKADHKIDDVEKSILMTQYWAVLSAITVKDV